MQLSEDKENLLPPASTSVPELLQNASPKRARRNGRSKSIGPGGLDELNASVATVNEDVSEAKNRRKSAIVLSVKSILPAKEDEAMRKAERRKSLANRRVSFAPEATLHTWDVIEYLRDRTTSTESPGSTRRGSNVPRNRSSRKASPTKTSDSFEQPSTPPEQEDDSVEVSSSPAPQRELHQKKRRRSSGIPPMNFNNPEDASSPSGIDDSTYSSEDEDGIESDGDTYEEDTSTAMSLDVEDRTQHSEESASSTSSSWRLDAALKQAAEVAGTRGIEYDEHGDMSMDIASEEITNAFRPWTRSGKDAVSSAGEDQENVNPFSPAFGAQAALDLVQRPPTLQEDDEGDLSMDFTKAVGGIVAPQNKAPSDESDDEDKTMEFTQAFGKVQSMQSRQKRRRSTTETGSPIDIKRRRSSAAGSSRASNMMELTVTTRDSQSPSSPRRPTRNTFRYFEPVSNDGDATMELTTAVGGIRSLGRGPQVSPDESFSMELTVAFGGVEQGTFANEVDRPVTPSKVESPETRSNSKNTTPKNQNRFKDIHNTEPRKLLTSVIQNEAQIRRNTIGQPSSTTETGSPSRRSSVSPFTVVETYPALPKGDHGAVSSPGVTDQRPPGLPPLDTPQTDSRRLLDTRAQHATLEPLLSPSASKQRCTSPMRGLSPSQRTSTSSIPPTVETTQQFQGESPNKTMMLADNIKLLATPRKETLKTKTPKTQTPAKMTMLRSRTTPISTRSAAHSPARSPIKHHEQIEPSRQPTRHVHLQEFLDEAGIRFMDLKTTSRRMATTSTPSKFNRSGSVSTETPEVAFENCIVAGACTAPELEMYSHACSELKRYLSDGKAEIKQLENETYDQTPPLIQQYINSDDNKKTTFDSQLREVKTYARYKSKATWYGWRGQLLNDLMKGLEGIGESLIKDDETLQEAEDRLEQELPPLIEQERLLSTEAERLEETVASISEEEKAELDAIRANLISTTAALEEQQSLLAALQRQAHEQEVLVRNLRDTKTEIADVVAEADRVCEACRGVSLNEMAGLKKSVDELEKAYAWTIDSATCSPPAIVMTYRKQLQLFFHPSAFKQNDTETTSRPNAPISLTCNEGPQSSTSLRFFLQLLQSTLHGLPQCATRLVDLLTLVKSGWDAALETAESERRLKIEGVADVRIVSDERLSVSSFLLLPKVKSKIQATFDITASVGEALAFTRDVTASVKVVYGELYKEDNMTAFVKNHISEHHGWDEAIRGLRERLSDRPPKGRRK